MKIARNILAILTGSIALYFFFVAAYSAVNTEYFWDGGSDEYVNGIRHDGYTPSIVQPAAVIMFGGLGVALAAAAFKLTCAHAGARLIARAAKFGVTLFAVGIALMFFGLA